MNDRNVSPFFVDDDIPINDSFLSKKNYNLEKKKRKKYNKKKSSNKIIWIILFILLLIIFSFSVVKLIRWYVDNRNTNENIEKIDEIADVQELKDDNSTELVNEPDTKNSDYWYYINFPLIQVDFNELVKKNSDTIGWIQVNNTNVNYPIVQTDNNNYYLNHSYDKSVNEAGWVFLDYRDNSDFSSKNNIIYAHSRLDKTMFGSLSKVLKSSWYQNKDNHIIKISTPTENSLWQIFSVYKIESETYYITTAFKSDASYLEFLNTIKNRSKYNFDTVLSADDTIITLSTCYSDTERTVVHAKKIKKSAR